MTAIVYDLTRYRHLRRGGLTIPEARSKVIVMKNPYGTLTRRPQEWGSKARKAEDKLRGMRQRGNRESIEDQLEDGE